MDRQGLLRELVLLEIGYRRAQRQVIRAEDYLQRFPGLDLPSFDWVERSLSEVGVAESQWMPYFSGYEILRMLGRGGSSDVYEAMSLAVPLPVALKMCCRMKDSPGIRVRFLAEVKSLARIHHPNIVSIIDAGVANDHPYFTMEILRGGSLDQKLRGHPLPPGEVGRLVETLARAVSHLHQAGIIHRDLKPHNILFRDGGSPVSSPVIIDFGLAKVLDEPPLTHTGAIMGTPMYMAPEQAEGREIGPAADIYALGSILYACLTGRPPFSAASMIETLHQVRNNYPVPPRQFNQSVPRDLETICLKCLEKNPQNRYSSAEALADDLRRFVKAKPIKARPIGLLERGWKWLRRDPVRFALGAGLLLGLTIGVSATWLLLRSFRG